MKTYHLRGSLIVAAALTAASLWSSPLHLTSLPYSNSDGWSLESSTWDNKVVIHPEAFTFDLKNYSYKLKVNTSCSVQIGRAQWDSSNTTESNFVNMGNGGGGDFYVDITSSLANIIKAEKEEDRYCIQFNNGSGKLYSIELIATEKDPGDVNIDFTKGLHTDGTRILDGNGNEFVMRGLNGAWANLDEDFAKSASAWGCNAVRLNISNGNPADNWMGYTMSSGQLDGIIEYCEKFKDMDANGWLRIRIGDCGQTAVYINTGTDHNKRGSDHLIGDSHDSGQYYFTDVSGTLDSKVSLSDFLAKLKQYGLRIDCNGNSLLGLEYIAPVYPEKPEPGEEDLAEIQVSWKCNRTIDSDNLSEYYIPASRFAGMTTDHSLFIECQPEESAQSSRRRAAAEHVIKLYTRPDSGTTILSMVDPTELNMPAGMLASNPGYNLAVDSDVLNRLQADGLYIGGSGYKLMNVKAVPHGIYTEVEEIEEPVSTLPDAIFTINGIRVEEMVPGNLYIVVRNGKPEKVLFKKN